MTYKKYEQPSTREFFYDTSFTDYIPLNETIVEKNRRLKENFDLLQTISSRRLESFRENLEQLGSLLQDLSSIYSKVNEC